MAKTELLSKESSLGTTKIHKTGANPIKIVAKMAFQNGERCSLGMKESCHDDGDAVLWAWECSEHSDVWI